MVLPANSSGVRIGLAGELTTKTGEPWLIVATAIRSSPLGREEARHGFTRAGDGQRIRASHGTAWTYALALRPWSSGAIRSHAAALKSGRCRTGSSTVAQNGAISSQSIRSGSS